MVNYEADTRYDREGDYIHSRCVEYDWCLKEFKSLFHNKNTEAEQIRILDVGSAKGDPVWIEELLNCGGCLTLLDYDEKPDEIECNYIKADVRDIPKEDNYFDAIFAISVLEHIGLYNAQTAPEYESPDVDFDGDWHAVMEL